jgi:fumarate reductase subunit C
MNRRQGERGYYRYKAYIPSRPSTWWLRNLKYFLFMMRELSSVFIAAFLLVYLYGFFLLSKGATVHEAFQVSLRSPAVIVFYAVSLVFALYHTITWFGVMGRIQVVRLGKLKVPPALVTAGAFAGWIAVSAVIGYFFFQVL